MLQALPFICLILPCSDTSEAGSELRGVAPLPQQHVPAKAYELIYEIVDEISKGRSGGKLSLGLLAAVWVASTGMRAIITALIKASASGRRAHGGSDAWWPSD